MSFDAMETGTGLDRLLGGGVQSGKALLLTGGPGAGKSLMGLSFIARGLQMGRSCIYVSMTQVPLSSTLQEARAYTRFGGLLSSEEPLFLVTEDLSSVLPSVQGAERVVLDHPEALSGDQGWVREVSSVITSLRRSGAAVMVLSYESLSPLVYVCDGVASISRTDGKLCVDLLKWPFGSRGRVAEGEAGEWLR